VDQAGRIEMGVHGGIKVLFFASLREEVGCGELDVEAANVTNVADVLCTLRETLSTAAMQALEQDNVRIAVNQQLIVETDMPLKSGDEVAFLPPVTGG
jgi:molybdopterin synthase sulfur carrier subunit